MNERVIFLEREDEIPVIVDAIKKTKADKVVIVLPKNSNVFQSIVNIKILRARAEEFNKWLFVITKDKKGEKMLEMIGIPAFETLAEFEATAIDKIFTKTKKGSSSKSSIKQIIFTASEIIEPEGKNEIIEPEEMINWRDVFFKPSKTLLITLTLISVGLFFFISTVVMPGATIYIKPERKTIETVMNITLTPNDSQEYNSFLSKQRTINSFPIEAEFEKKIQFNTLTKIFEGKNASGNIVIVNTFNEERTLKPQTRFQSENGVVYRISDWVRIPPATSEGYGELVVNVVADEKDIFGEFAGDKGNLLAPQKLIIPALPPAGQQILWGEVREDIKGGVTLYKPKVTEEDFDIAKKNIEELITKEAQLDLEKYLKEKNALEFTNLTLLPENKFFKKEIIEITVPKELLNTDVENFEVYAKLKVKSWAYDSDELLSVLRQSLEKSVDPDMFLEMIDSPSIVIDVFSKEENSNNLKVNIIAKGIEAYLIEPKTESGIRFVNKVKREIINQPINEAEKILVNFQEISDVKITVWPFFARRIPRLPENISVKIWEE